MGHTISGNKEVHHLFHGCSDKVAPLQPEPEPELEPEHWEGSEILLVTVGAVCQQGEWVSAGAE